MALEGLLTKLGPTLVREVSPHLVQLVSGFAERFRSDSREMKAAVDAEIAALGKAQAALAASVDRQHGMAETLQAQVAALDQKLDLLLAKQDVTARQMETIAQQVGNKPTGTPTVLIVLLTAVFLVVCVCLALLLRHG